MHVTEAQGISSVGQITQVRSYPLERDNPDECSGETEHQAEEPEHVHPDADRVDAGVEFGDKTLACSLGSNLPQELKSRIRSELHLRLHKESGHDGRE